MPDLVLRAATLIDGTGADPCYDAEVVVSNGVITYAGPASLHADDADVIDILKTGPDLDQAYLNHWLGEWEVVDRYERLVALASVELRGDPAQD